MCRTQCTQTQCKTKLVFSRILIFLFGNLQEKDYVLYQRTAATAFQVRFKLCRDNEKGNQTEDMSAFTEYSDAFEFDGQIQEPLVDYGKQLSQWLNVSVFICLTVTYSTVLQAVLSQE